MRDVPEWIGKTDDTKAPGRVRACATCGGAFQAAQWQIARGGGKYCSRRCYERKARTLKDQRVNFYDNCIPEPNSGCWLWMGSVMNAGYGIARFNNRAHLAHRVSYGLTHGEVDRALVVCHQCDNPICVNPDHLFIGTQADNIRDCVAKKRNSTPVLRGSLNPQSKLTEVDVSFIRQDRRPVRAIAREYGVGSSIIQSIRSGKTWRHVK